jgi:hypothetical protein
MKHTNLLFFFDQCNKNLLNKIFALKSNKKAVENVSTA